MKRKNLSAFALGLMLALSTTACGKGVGVSAEKIVKGKDPILTKDPAKDLDVGPIDGIWSRTDTACTQPAHVRDNIKSLTYYINNAIGNVTIVYKSEMQVSIPASFT